MAQTLTLTPDDDALRDRLQGEAAVFALDAQARPDDVIATAQGDYGRLLAALYDAGYFSAAISIRLGGREAATLSTFDARGAVRPI
ncbi:MAG: outer membrane protein assembly factor, partial [Pseudomonadota bacterium]